MPKHFFITLYLGLFTLLFTCVSFADTTFVNRPDVQSFIKTMVKKHDFKQSELTALFKSVKIRPKIIQTLKAPAEQQPWYAYQNAFITQAHIREGVKYWNRNAEALKKAEKIYGVPASIIVATIGVETNYGKIKGSYPVIDALSNIAFSDSPRALFFRQELEQFLLLTREQHLDPLTVMGSYAGAIGQPQFMPSSYRHYAISFSGNSRIDLSNNPFDIIASVANYYKKHGWKTHQPVAIQATVDKNQRHVIAKKSHHIRNESKLAKYGIVPSHKVPAHQKVKIITLQGYHGNEYWIGLHNFDVIKSYNPSNLYAMAVYQLSSYITGLRERLHHAQ